MKKRRKLSVGIALIVIVGIAIFQQTSKTWVTQKVKTLEMGSQINSVDLVTIARDVQVGFSTSVKEPYPLGEIEFSFIAKKNNESKQYTFTYNVVDTTAPVIEKTNEPVISVGADFNLLNYVKVTDNSGENLDNKLSYKQVPTDKAIESSVELNVKDSSGNESKFLLNYSVIDPVSAAPDLIGTKKIVQIINGIEKVTYVAEQGNTYGIDAGLYVGEFKKEVIFEGKKVGGVVLIPKIITKLLRDKTGQAVFIPADISEVPQSVTVELNFLNATIEGKDYSKFILELNSNGQKVSISNPTLNSHLTALSFFRSDLQLDPDNKSTIILSKNRKMSLMNELIPELYFKGFLPLGKKVGETEKNIGIIWNDSQATEPAMLAGSDILHIGNAIVFLKNSESGTPSKIVYNGDTKKPEISLTFDDGGPGLVSILNTLNQRGIKGTFFLLARELRSNPEIWRQAVRDGHQICNHTVGHRMDLYLLSEEKMKEEIIGWEIAAKEVLGEEYGERMKRDFPFFRSPGGTRSEKLQKVLGELGYSTTAYWSHEDVWIMRAKNNPNHISLTQYYISSASNGDIYLAHGGTASILPAVIDGIKARGYQFKLLSEILDY